jgi:hypothetical protein
MAAAASAAEAAAGQVGEQGRAVNIGVNIAGNAARGGTVRLRR